MTVTPSRRQLLSAAALLPVAACTHRAVPAKPDPDDAIRAAALERERALLALYEGATGAAAAIRAEHEAHVVALATQPTAERLARPTTSPAASPSPAIASRRSLVAAERAAAAAHASAALDASPELAAVLASLAASEASHPVALA